MKIKFRLLEDLQDQSTSNEQQQQQQQQMVNNNNTTANQQQQQENKINENNSYESLVEKLNSIKNSYDLSVFQVCYIILFP